MKKLFISVGLAAASTASLHATYAPDSTVDTSKAWSISGTLRGFYDDNYNTANSNVRGSYGFEVSPQISVNVPMQQTEFGARYIYGLYYYQDRQEQDQNPVDQTHQFDLWLDHAFTERWQARVQNSFVIGQEPELLNPAGGGVATPFRVNGNNIANAATATLTTDWTRLFSTVLTYQNNFYDYDNSGGTATDPSLAGLLNRDENAIALDFEWHTTPTTVFLVGYRYDQINYTADEPISPEITFLVPTPLPHFTTVRERYSDDLNNFSHIGYVGVQSSLMANLSGAAKVGVQYTDDYNDPQGVTSVGPYVLASLTYTYLPGCYVQIGVTHTRNATSEVRPDTSNGSIAVDQESTVVYGSINHKITPKLIGSLTANFQNSEYNGGSYDGKSDNLFDLGLNFNYAFTRNFSAEVGYNYDNLDSEIQGLSYNRNRVYVGVTASY